MVQEIIELRKPVWIALSEFYLDSGLENDDLERIATIFFKSPYDLEEIRVINLYEVKPILYSNLQSAAGVWSGFDENWLVEKITDHIKDYNLVYHQLSKTELFIRSLFEGRYWKKIEKFYTALCNQP